MAKVERVIVVVILTVLFEALVFLFHETSVNLAYNATTEPFMESLRQNEFRWHAPSE